MHGSRSHRRLFLEGLESRRLLTTSPVVLDDGVLSIVGTHKHDRIQVALVDTTLTVKVNRQCFQFAAADVTSLVVDGGKGNDWIEVSSRVLLPTTLWGGAGDDAIRGGGGDDIITGDKGRDKLSGGGGNDALSGGAGDDCLDGGAGDDVVHGDEGSDRISGGEGIDELWGDSGHDKLEGGDGDDQLRGGTGKDHLSGGRGNDALFGEDDKDQLWGGDGDDWLNGGSHDDQLWGDGGDDTLKGEGGHDKLDGGRGMNRLDGDDGRNKYKNGEVVDLDVIVETPVLVAELNDFSGRGIAGQARFETVVENGVSVQRFTVTVENVPPPQGGGQDQFRVVVEELWLGDLSIDPATGRGTFSLTGVEILPGYFVSIGSSLSGIFAEV